MKNLLILSTLFIYTFGVKAQENDLSVFVRDSLENYVIRGMAKWEIPGLAIAIVKNGKIQFMRGFGTTKVGGSQPVNDSTLFMIGSITKTFTSTAIALLQADGKLNLEDKVQKWIPEFKLKDPLASKETNISDLLSNRIGLGIFQGDFIFFGSDLSKEQIIQRIGLLDLRYGFRSRYSYTNAGFFLAGEVIHRTTDLNWEEVIREKILLPLKMENTLTLSKEYKNASNKATGYTLFNDSRTETPVMQLDNLAPAGSMSSCAKDMATWLIAHLNNGKIDGNQVISNSAIQAIRRPYTIIGMDTRYKQATHFSLSGLGLNIMDRKGVVVYSHSGGVPGFASSFLLVPEENFGITILTNTDYNLLCSGLENEILDALLDLPYQGYSDKSLAMLKQYRLTTKSNIDSLKKIVNLKNKPSLSLEAFAGKYQNDLYGEIEIKLVNGILNMSFMHHPNLIGKLEHIINNTFLCTYSDINYGIVELPFNINNDKVQSFILRVTPNLEPTPYTFIKMN